MLHIARLSPIKFFLGLLICCFGVSYIFVSYLIQLEYESNRAAAYASGESQSALISTTISHNMSANHALASLIRFSNGNVSLFESYSSELKKQYPLASHFSLSPGGVIKWVYPLAGNEDSIGLNQLSDPDQKEMALLAKQSQKLTLAGPIHLVQGGKALIGRWPVWIEEENKQVFWGFTNVVVRLENFLKEVNLPDLAKQGYHYRLERVNDNDINSFIATSTNHLMEEQHWVEINIEIPNGNWILKLSPKKGWLSKSTLVLNIGVAVILSLLFAGLGGLLWHIFLIKSQLETIVEERTREVVHTHNRLKSLLHAIPDMLFELDDDGVILYSHTPNFDFCGFSVDKVIGRNIHDLLPLEVTQCLNEAFIEARARGHSIGKIFSFINDDRIRWFELSVTYSNKEEGVYGSRYVVLPRDITVRKESELELRIAATAFESQDAMIITDIYKNILRVNKAFELLTGYSESEVLGKSTDILNSNHHKETFYQSLHSQLRMHGYWEGEIWSRKKMVPSILSY
ncbi:PAS domain S-box protein [Marinomonas sp. 15G1-11]|uniref:PAS domain S-box protein n=1 Tax=Marinomonas phaeophyticola TaxID=3004091 RepID=A0ABT4JZH2_9GAMM|nr:PAS domain S-box protein [Marinomonas sp. 15G1-11]MCZ2723641.1 PAS domain S-box protein [Marinomonas sp. 15G1-11]